MPELIDKTAAYNALKHEAETHELSFSSEAYGRSARIIDQMPTIKAEPVRHGRWIDKGEYAVCTECGGKSDTQYDGVQPVALLTDFCPHCGATMRAKTTAMTNGDRIRRMTDEELVMALDTDCNRCARSENCELYGDPVSYGICVKGNIEWLEQEVDAE